MEEQLTNMMEEQRQKMIERFKKMSIKYVIPEKRELWCTYIDNFYSNKENSISSMEEIVNYMAQLTAKSHPTDVATLFMRRTSAFNNASDVAKVVAFFSLKGEEFYQELTSLATKEKNTSIVDASFLHNLHEINKGEDIDLAIQLFSIKPINILIGDTEISAIMHDNGFIKGLTKDSKVVIGEKINNYYAIYIIETDGTYQRCLMHDPASAHINTKRQSTWGFINNEKGKFIVKIANKPEIKETNINLTLEEYESCDNIYDNLDSELCIIPILYEIYSLTKPINSESKITTIQAIMFREMQESLRLDKELK